MCVLGTKWWLNFLLRCSQTEIHRLFRSVYGEGAIDVSTVRHWVRGFKSGVKDTGDRPNSDRPAMAATSAIVLVDSWSNVPQFRATRADIKETERRSSKGSAKQEDESGLPPAWQRQTAHRSAHKRGNFNNGVDCFSSSSLPPQYTTLRGPRFADETKHEVLEELRRLSKVFYATGIERLTLKWKVCW
jgi:hypothetical protein